MAAAEAPRSRRPGRKRLLITVATLLSFALAAPFWYKSTQVYRAALPFDAIDAYARWAAASRLRLGCHLHVLLVGGENHAELDSVAAGVRRRIGALAANDGTCEGGVQVLVMRDGPAGCVRSEGNFTAPIWPCGLWTPAVLHSLVSADDDEAVDEILRRFSRVGADSETGTEDDDEGGRYTVVVVDIGGGIGGGGCGLADDGKRREICRGFGDGGPRTVVGKYRHAWIVGDFGSGEEDELAAKVGNVAASFFGNAVSGSSSKSRGAPLSADGEAILSFSLLNANPRDWIFDWDFEDLERRFVAPAVEALRGVARLRVESQVLYYTPKAVRSRWAPGLGAHVVAAEQLPFFVNANEWHLDSSSAAAGRCKILHFAVYVPAAREWPLRFQSAEGDDLLATNAFTSPGWGGVAVWNPNPETARASKDENGTVSVLSAEEFGPLAAIFIAQLRTLFGLDRTSTADERTGIFSLPAYATGFADWELDVLARRQAMADVAAAAATLKSLSRLVRKMPNMLIMDEIGEQVKASLAAAAAARKWAARGIYGAAAEAAREAKSLAEEAFFQPSIMSLLYNPAEHHLAIYTPFFVPVLLHAVLAVVKEVGRYRREWRRYKQKLQ